MQSILHADRVQGILAQALIGRRNVQRKSLTGWEWSAAGNCSSPIMITLNGRPARDRVSSGFVSGGVMRMVDGRHTTVTRENAPIFCDIEVRCRRCERCAKARSAMWRERSIVELKRASRTWFLTLTVRPDDRYRLELQARLVAKASGQKWGDLTEDERFARVCAELGKHVTLYLKRVRKSSKAALRYFMVYERHKDGFPHVHMLLHETDAGRPVRKAVLAARDAEHPEGQWLLGHSQVKLVRLQGQDIAKAAFYLAKYVSKDARIRIRASIRYGRNELCEKTPSGHSPAIGGSVETMTREETAAPGGFLRLSTREELEQVRAAVAVLFSPNGSGKAFKPRLKSKRDHWYHPEPE